MKRSDRIKLTFTRNWKFPGKERLSNLLKPSAHLKSSLKDGIVWLDNEDIAINTSADSYIEWSILSTGTYEDEIAKLIRISLWPGGVCLDIGANIGLQSLRMAQCVGINGKVYAFEPLGYLQKKLKLNLSLNCAANVRLFPYALSDAEGEAVFKIDTNMWNQGAFSLSSGNNGPESQTVAIKVADNMPEIQLLETLNLIKIDVEGFEYHVLKGLKQTLLKHRPRIIFEYDDNYWLKTGQDIKDCYAFLQALNYTLYQIFSVGCELIKAPGDIVSGNLFCIQNQVDG